MKKGLIIAGGVLVFLIAAALIAPSFIDWNSYRPEIAAKARELTGREVEIGEISFRILPSPALSAANVSIANLAGGTAEKFVTLKSLDVRVALFPLIAGNIQVESIVLDGPVIALERLADGRENWQIGDQQSSEQGQGGGAVSLDRFVIRNGVISYSDAISGISERIEGVSGEITIQSMSGPMEGEGRLTYNNIKVAFAGAVGRMEPGRKTGVRLDLVLADQQPGLNFNGTVLADAENPGVEGRLRGGAENFQSFATALAEIAGMDVSLPTGLAQTFDLDATIALSSSSAEIRPLTFRIGEMAGEGSVSATLGDQTQADIALAVNTLRLENWLSEAAGGTEKEAAAFELPADVTAGFDLSVNAIEYKGSVISKTAVVGELANGSITITRAQSQLPGGSDIALSGMLSAQNNAPFFDGQIRAGSSNLRALLTWLEMDVDAIPDGQLTSFNLQSALRATDKSIRLTGAESQLDISRVTGDIIYTFADRLTFSLDAGVNRINLDAYFPAAEEALTWDQQVQGLKDSLKPLADMDADINVRVEQATYGGAPVRNFALNGSLRQGAVNLSQISIGNYRGVSASLSGTIGGLASNPQFNLNVAVASANPDAFVRWAELELPVRAEALGPLDIKGNISGTFTDLKLDLNGGILGGAAGIKGTLNGLKPAPDALNLTLTLEHPSHVDLFRRLDQGDLIAPSATRPVRIGANITGRDPDYSGTVTADILGGNATLDGAMTMGPDGLSAYKGTLAAAHPRLKDLMQALIADFSPASDRLGPFRLNAQVAGSNSELKVTGIDGLFGPTSAKGSLSADMRGARPVITAALTADDIPADAFLPPEETGAEQATRAGGERWSREPLGVEFLREFDGTFTLKANSLTTSGYSFTNPNLAFAVKEGKLTISDLSGGLFGGQAVLTGGIDASQTPRLNANIKLSNVALERLLQTTAAIRPATGTVSFDGAFSATGNSQFDLMSALSGQADLSATSGVIRRINLPQLSERMKTLNRLPDFLALLGTALTGGETAYRSLAAKIAANQGTLSIGNFAADIDGADVSAQGQINLAAWSMNAGGSLRLKDHPAAPPIGVNIAGDVNNPKIDFRTDAIKSFMAQRLATAVFKDVLGGGQSGGLEDLTKDGETEAAPPKPGEALLNVLFNALGKKKKEGETDPPN